MNAPVDSKFRDFLYQKLLNSLQDFWSDSIHQFCLSTMLFHFCKFFNLWDAHAFCFLLDFHMLNFSVTFYKVPSIMSESFWKEISRPPSAMKLLNSSVILDHDTTKFLFIFGIDTVIVFISHNDEASPIDFVAHVLE